MKFKKIHSLDLILWTPLTFSIIVYLIVPSSSAFLSVIGAGCLLGFFSVLRAIFVMRESVHEKIHEIDCIVRDIHTWKS